MSITEFKAALKTVKDVHERQLTSQMPKLIAGTIEQENAALRLASGEPAFCSKASSGNQPAGTFYAATCRLGSIEAAQTELESYFKRNGRDVFSEQWLDDLIPLNPEAVSDLVEAYTRAGTFRSLSEIWTRMERAVGAVAVPQAAE